MNFVSLEDILREEMKDWRFRFWYAVLGPWVRFQCWVWKVCARLKEPKP